MDTKELYAGKIEIKSITVTNISGVEFNITQFVNELNIYEDFTSCMVSGNLVINDTGAMINQVGIIGHEKLKVVLKSPGMPADVELVYLVSKMDNGTQVSPSHSVYLLHFVSYETLKNQLTKVAKSFKGNVATIVKQIFSDTFNSNLMVGSTQTSLQFVSPYWTPFEVINWLSNKTIDAEGVPSFFFFANTLGYHFLPITELYRQPPIINYTYRQMDVSGGILNEKKYEYQMQTVRNFKVIENFNFIESLSRGLLAGELFVKDLTTNQYGRSDYNYLKVNNTFTHLNQMSIIPTGNAFGDNYIDNKSELRYATTHSQIFDNYPSSTNVEHYVLNRISLIEAISATRVQIQVPGHLELSIGKIINLEVPMTGSQERKMMDPTLSGRYLITAARHIINGKSHEVVLELSKDSYTAKVN